MGALSERNVNVAFDIPVQKRNITIKTPIQKKLETRQKAPSPTEKEIKSKLSKADKNRATLVAESAAAHNNGVLKKRKEQKIKEADGLTKLEQSITSRLGLASERKKHLTSELVTRVGASVKWKLERGTQARQEEEDSARQLRATVEEKVENAAEKKARLLEKRAATQKYLNRRKMEKKARLLEKTELASEAQQKFLKTKLNQAAERKEKLITDSVDGLVAKTNDTLSRGRKLRRQEQKQTNELEANIESKMASADRKREMMVLEQVKSLERSSKKKESLVFDLKARLEDARNKLDRKIKDRLMSASKRKEEKAHQASQHTKRTILKAMDVQESKEAAARDLQERVEAAVERHELLMNEKAHQASKNTKRTILKAMDVQESKEAAARDLDRTIKMRLQSATKRKEDRMREKVEALSAKHQALKKHRKDSPSPEKIEQRLLQASQRRETYLHTRGIRSSATKSNTARKACNVTAFVPLSPGNNSLSPSPREIQFDAKTDAGEPLGIAGNDEANTTVKRQECREIQGGKLFSVIWIFVALLTSWILLQNS